jgi:hypothetical protein
MHQTRIIERTRLVLRCGLDEPAAGLGVVLRPALAGKAHIGDRDLGSRIALVSRTLVPAPGAFKIYCHA